MNTDIIARWRDAITDPPPEGIMCIVRRGDIRDHGFRAVSKAAVVFVDACYESYKVGFSAGLERN